MEDCLLLFTEPKSSDPDYHSEMISEVFLKCLEETVFLKMKEGGKKCGLVLDRAKYHTMVTDDTRIPTRSWRKRDFIDAIKPWDRTNDDSALV